MDEKRMSERIQSAVEQRCKALAPDPFLAARVMRMAEQKGERKVKKKLSVVMALSIVLALLSLTALAAVLLSGMEIVDQQAVPVAQGNDGAVRVNGMYSHEELAAIVALAAENGISLENESSIMEALAKGEGYYEEELIMAICREAFGGLFYEWNVEQRYWYGEKMVEIGFRNNNPYRLPGEGQIAPAEARELAVSLLLAEFPDAALTDPEQYRIVEDFGDSGWYFTFYPRSLTASEYSVHFSHDQSVVETHCTPQSWETYSEAQLMNAIHQVYGYRTHTQQNWGLEGWHAFGQLLPGATRTNAWSAEYDGYLATAYLLPQEGDITADEAKAIALKDAGADTAIKADMLLLGKGDRRIWKVTLRLLNGDGEAESRSWEIDAATGIIDHRMTHETGTHYWARFMLFETYEVVCATVLSEDSATEAAIAALRAEYGDLVPALDDPALYKITFHMLGDNQTANVIFRAVTLEGGNAAVMVHADGTAHINYAHFGPLTADNLHDRMDNLHGSSLSWDPSVWAEFDRMQDTLDEPQTFEGKLFAATTYPEASAARVTLDEALDAVALDLGSRADDAISWVLIEGNSGPVWKIRMGTFPANTLYEVDATTGEILDRELYVCQNPDFDHSMKMFTLRSTYMPAALAEFGPVRIAMELTVKSDHAAFSYDETIFMNRNCYEVTVEGMTVTFKSIDGSLPSYRTTILDGGMDAQIEVFDIPEPTPATEGPAGGNG